MDWDTMLNDHRKVVEFVETDMRPVIEAAAGSIIQCIAGGGKLLICGNGGSAADAQHFACELVNRFLIADSPAWPALALTTDSSIMTSVANDVAGRQVFARQVDAFGTANDILIAISTSGNSPNVVEAVKMARVQGMRVIGLLGGDGGEVGELADETLTVACLTKTPRIQEGHLIIIHALCEIVEAELARSNSTPQTRTTGETYGS